MNTQILNKDLEYIVGANNIDWSVFADKTILISGANGFLPAYMVETLLYLNSRFNYNVKVIALVRNIEKAKKRFAHHSSNDKFVYINQDVSDPIYINESIDYIIHAASQASPKYYGSDPVGTLKANVLGTYNLLELAKEKNVKSFLFFSSNEIYGVVPVELNPQSESVKGYLDPCAVRSCYAESKRMGENMCVSWHEQFGVNTKIVRIFHSYGPGMSLDDGRVFADFVKNILNNQNLELNSDGTALRAFCYISDATRAFFKILLDAENATPYNMGNPDCEISIRELAKLLVDLYPEKNTKIVMNIPQNDKGYIKSPLSRGLPNIDKLKQLGWSPTIGLSEGFRRTIQSFE